MNVKRFTARNSRDALGLVKQAFGQDAVVLSTRPCAEGVEVLAMPPDAVPPPGTASRSSAKPALPSPASLADSPPAKDAERLSMSTLSFQDYVRERMLRRRKAEMQAKTAEQGSTGQDEPEKIAPTDLNSEKALNAAASSVRLSEAVKSLVALDVEPRAAAAHDRNGLPSGVPANPLKAREMANTRRYVSAGAPAPEPHFGEEETFSPYGASEPPMLHAVVPPTHAVADVATQSHTEHMLQELRGMRDLIEQRFGALAYQEKLQRDPRGAQLLMRLMQAGFSPALTRRLCDNLAAEGDALEWAAGVLQRNLHTGERDMALEDVGGVFAFVGATGCGKTASTAKLAAACAARHGAAQLGIISLDATRSGHNETLRAFGRAIGVSVHNAQDRNSLDDLLDLLSGKKVVLIDTAGVSSQDERTRDVLNTLNHRTVKRLLVLNATSQGEMLDEAIAAFRGSECHGVVLSKVDEAVKLAPALDAVIRHKLKVLAVANGQRIPEDWHRLGAHALVHRALRSREGAAWKLNPDDVQLVFMQTRHAVGVPA